MMGGAFRIIGIAAIVFLIAAQLAEPGWHNHRVDPSQTIESQMQVPANVLGILNRACQDCHTDKTQWRWYAYIAPMSWLQVADVQSGRNMMNLSQWGRATPAQRADHLKEICKQVQEGDMPLWYYKPLHPASWLSDSDKTALCDWTKAELAKLPPQPEGEGHSH
jgi:heme-binding protein